MAQQSARRGRKNQGFPPCFISTLRVMWFRSANSHTGPQPSSLHQRPDRWQHPTTRQILQITACVARGVHRWEAAWQLLGQLRAIAAIAMMARIGPVGPQASPATRRRQRCVAKGVGVPRIPPIDDRDKRSAAVRRDGLWSLGPRGSCSMPLLSGTTHVLWPTGQKNDQKHGSPLNPKLGPSRVSAQPKSTG